MTPKRNRFPETRKGKTKRITVDNIDLYIIVNCLDCCKPGEVFIVVGKQGSTMSAMFDALATTISISLQYGVPWAVLKEKYIGHNFEPKNAEGKSILHCVAEAIEELCNADTDTTTT